MREIKFRAWDSEYKTMVDNCGVLNGNAWDIRLMKSRMIPLETTALEAIENIVHERIILMQYTGLKDKNGKEIYEGDILKNDHGVFDVLWNVSRACFSVREMHKSVGTGLHVVDIFSEIIGNIYENPELLKETQNGQK